MGELGERLRAAREDRGLTLEQVAEETRISLIYLQALEDESFDKFTSDLHTRGFLRNYASYLGLDLGAGIAGKGQARGLHKKQATAPLVPQPQQTPRMGQEPTGARRPSTVAVDGLLALAVVALLALAVLAAIQFRSGWQKKLTPTAGPPPTPSVTPAPIFEGTEYTLDAKLNYAEHKLEVRERIDYTNATSQTLSDLVLNVYPNHTRNAFKLSDVRVDVDGERVPPEVAPLDVRLTVKLPRELKPNEHTALYLSFSLSLPQIQPAAEFSDASFGYSKRSVSLGNWYPVVAPYRKDNGWYGLTTFPVGDAYVSDVADYHVTITATEGVILAGTGKESRDGNVWHYEATNARSFAVAASNAYQVASLQTGNTMLRAYYFPSNQAAAEAALQTASQALKLFSELYGVYPEPDYRIAETEFAGGMEFTGLTFLGAVFFDEYDGSSRTPLIPLTAHEVAHQWFYGLVGSDQVAQPWLDEALAEYSALLYYEKILPGDTDWWWTYAVDQWAPTGKIDALIYEFRDNRGYMDAVYRRGAQFMRDLRKTMSDPAFFAFLKEYVRRYSYRTATSQDFFRLVREFTTADLVPLQEEYFRQRILP